MNLHEIISFTQAALNKVMDAKTVDEQLDLLDYAKRMMESAAYQVWHEKHTSGLPMSQ